MRPAALISALAVLAAGPAAADDYFADAQKEEVAYRIDRSRTNRQRWILGGLAGGTLLFGGLGLYFHLESRDLSDQVSAQGGEHTGRIYTPQVDATREDALSARTLAIAGYSAGGAALLATIVYFIVTDPGEEYVTLTPGAAPVVVPISGGAVLGAQVRF
jgi:hypothetical protein